MKPAAHTYTPGEIIARREQAREVAANSRAFLDTYLVVITQRLNEQLDALRELGRGERRNADDVRALVGDLWHAQLLLNRIACYAAGPFREAQDEHLFFDTLAATVRVDDVA